MEVLHISCNMCTHDLLDMYALSPRALGIHIRQIPCAHVTTITYTMAWIEDTFHCLNEASAKENSCVNHTLTIILTNVHRYVYHILQPLSIKQMPITIFDLHTCICLAIVCITEISNHICSRWENVLCWMACRDLQYMMHIYRFIVSLSLLSFFFPEFSLLFSESSYFS